MATAKKSPKAGNNLAAGVSEPENVNDFIKALNHPFKDVVVYLRNAILSVDKNIGEGIYWNAPTFYFTGKMKPFHAKEYKRFIVGFVFNRKDCLRLVFLRGASATDKSGILEGDYKDGRRLAVFASMADAKKKGPALKSIIKELVKKIHD